MPSETARAITSPALVTTFQHQQPLSCTGDHLPAAATTSPAPATTSPALATTFLQQQQLPVLNWRPLPCSSSYQSCTSDHLPAPAATSPARVTTSPDYQTCTSSCQPCTSDHLPATATTSPTTAATSPAPAIRSCTSNHLPAMVAVCRTLFRFLQFAIIKFGLQSNHLSNQNIYRPCNKYIKIMIILMLNFKPDYAWWGKENIEVSSYYYLWFAEILPIYEGWLKST